MEKRLTRGFTLVELMVALTLGLILVGVCLTMFQSSSRTYAAAEALGRIQEGARIAFELMVRDLREAAGNPCEEGLPTYNVLNGAADRWFHRLSGSVRGYGGTTPFPDMAFGSSIAARVAGTDAIEIKGAVDGVTVVAHHPEEAAFTLVSEKHGFTAGDIAVACDFSQVAIFQVSSVLGPKIEHQQGVGVPGNCSSGLGWSATPNCTIGGNRHAFGCYMGMWADSDCADTQPSDSMPDRWPAMVAKLRATRWYIGNSAHGRSLFRARIRNRTGVLSVQAEEMVQGVQSLDLAFLLKDASEYVQAISVSEADWNENKVVAVRVSMTSQVPEKVDGIQVQRTMEHIANLRNING